MYYGNCPDLPYQNHAVATAETRAEGRALKRALNLARVVTAEEVATSTVNHQTGQESDSSINDSQIKLLSIMCANDNRGLDINVEKFVAHVTSKSYNSIRELSKEQGIELAKQVSTFQQDKDSIPDDIKGYDSSWFNTFGK